MMVLSYKKMFFVIGTNCNGIIKTQSSDLSSQIKPRYYVRSELNSNDKKYISIVPTYLSNDNIVKIKFFIKKDNINTYKFPNDFSNTPIKIIIFLLNNKNSNKKNSNVTIDIIVGSIVETLVLGILDYYLIRLKKTK